MHDLQQHSHVNFEVLPSTSHIDMGDFDDLDDVEPELEQQTGPEPQRSTVSNLEILQTPEIRTNMMPSTSRTANRAAQDMEMDLRKQQAKRYLSGLKELIADKSFQYSHVIRKAPRKTVRTRACSSIAR